MPIVIKQEPIVVNKCEVIPFNQTPLVNIKQEVKDENVKNVSFNSQLRIRKRSFSTGNFNASVLRVTNL